MGSPCDEILRNHSKGLSGRFYTLWAVHCLSCLLRVQVKAGANGWLGGLLLGGQVSAITQMSTVLER
jgi:hypothetical protein